MSREVSKEDYQWVILTGFLTMFICWALHEFLERKLGMSPRIITSIDLQQQATKKENPLKTYEINNRYCVDEYIGAGTRRRM